MQDEQPIWTVMEAIKGWRWGPDGTLERWPPAPAKEEPAEEAEAAE